MFIKFSVDIMKDYQLNFAVFITISWNIVIYYNLKKLGILSSFKTDIRNKSIKRKFHLVI